MTSVSGKRQRTSMADSSGSKAKKAQKTPQTELGITRLQLEQAPPDGQSSMAFSYQPTYRATLAKKGILVRSSLGAGTYSKVRMGVDLSKGKDVKVAIKIVDRMIAPKDYLEKFMPRELTIWATLQHPNLVALKDCFQDYRRTYMVLEFLEGGDCLKYIQKRGPVPECLARHWVLQTGGAVRYLHLRNISHRDLKLENLLLDEYGNIKVCDFGFIKDNCSFQLSETFCGSKSYVAPEILLGTAYNPKKSDVWALGAILYIMVTGKMPFDEFKGTKSILCEQQELNLFWPDNVSHRCMRLIRWMFTYAFKSRPNISSILSDKWFGLGASSRAIHFYQPSRVAGHKCTATPTTHTHDTRKRHPPPAFKPTKSVSDDIVVTGMLHKK